MAVIRDKDRGFKKRVRKLFKAARRRAVTVGIHDDAGGYENGISVSDVASIHEFGLGGFPEKSFLRAWADADRTKIEATITRIGESVVRGQDPDVAVERLGVFLAASAQKYIQDGRVAPATDKDGTTLIETSQLVSSITHEVES